MASRQEWLTPGTILLPAGVFLAYGAVTGIGFAWPEHPTVSMVAAIVVSIVCWTASAWWFRGRTH